MIALGGGLGPRGAKKMPPPGMPGHPDREMGEADSPEQEYAEGEPCPECGGEYGPDGTCEECGAKKPAEHGHKGKGVSLTIVIGHAPTQGLLRRPKR